MSRKNRSRRMAELMVTIGDACRQFFLMFIIWG